MEARFQDDVSQQVFQMLTNEEKRDPHSELAFSYQVLSVCLDAFAHGTNDVANSIGPMAVVYGNFENFRIFFDTQSKSRNYF